MAEIMRMRKFPMPLNSVRVKIQLNLWERSLDSFWRAVTWDQKTFIIAENSEIISRSYYLHNNLARIVLKSIQKFDSHVKLFLIVVSFQVGSASCLIY